MNNKNKNTWNDILEFLNTNPDIKNIPYSNISFNKIINDIENYLPYIYDDIQNATELKSAGLMILCSYSYRRNNRFDSINWVKDIIKLDIISINKKILLSYANSKFICYWALVILLNTNIENNNDLITMYKKYVCDNYPETAMRTLEELLSTNRTEGVLMNDLLNYCKNILDIENRINHIKDFSIPDSRLMAYSKQRQRQIEKINKEAENKSVFMNLVTKTTIKYGARSAHIRSINDSKTLIESNYHHFEYKIEMPRIFLSDPAYYKYCLFETFGRER